jgi:hypothetical protein
MKLRIKGNSLRLRLTKSEVDAFKNNGIFSEKIQFGINENQSLSYNLVRDKTAVNLNAKIENQVISILVPSTIANNWTDSNEVGFEGMMPIDTDNELFMLIEKDFVCLDGDVREDQSDNYEHPNAENHKC